MPIALTVFGVEAEGLYLTLVRVMLRTVRGPGIYPEPNLSQGMMSDGPYRTKISDSELTLVTWDKILSEDEEQLVETQFAQGFFLIPEECPIAGGERIVGQPFGPLITIEKNRRARVTGTGPLLRKGLVSESLLIGLNEALSKGLKPGAAPKALLSISLKLCELSGMKEVLKARNPIGVVDFFFRTAGAGGIDGSLFEVVPIKPDFRTSDPMLKVSVHRFAAPLDRSYKLQVTLKNYDEVIRSTLIDIEAGVLEVTLLAPIHITDVSVSVFDNNGELADQLCVQFLQGTAFGLSMIGAIDKFPPLFPGNPKSHDLESRPRVHTMAFEGPSIGNRSGGIDLLRKQAVSISEMIGPLTGAENIWFEQGVESQIEVIRWIKKKIEQPGVTTAYLVDPYLGSEAVKRVVARQGNETAELLILVSPGDIDPDAEKANTSIKSSYLENLKSTLNEWADKLAGRISVVHIKRGNGSEQAFHDRYLCIIDQKGIPTTYMLSNSLSKAARYWPFAICELNKIMSRQVYTYILDLIEGGLNNKNLQAELIWKSEKVEGRYPDKLSRFEYLESEPEWRSVKDFLSDIFNIIIRNSTYKPQVGARLNTFLSVWPKSKDEERLAEELFKVVSHRDAIVVFVSEQLRDHGRDKIADYLDNKFLDRFLEQLPSLHQKSRWFVPSEARQSVLVCLGRTIARKQNASNFIRAKLNSKIHELITMIETQRNDRSEEALQVVLSLSNIVLRVIIEKEEMDERFRRGIAIDYIYWLGRIMRSDTAASMFAAHKAVFPDWLEDLTSVSYQLARARFVLGEPLNAPITQIKNDIWVASIFKESISAALITQSG